MLGNKTLDDLLGPISASLGRAQAPQHIDAFEPATQVRRPTDGLDASALVELFAAEAAKVRVEVHRCRADDLAETVAGIVAVDPGEVVISRDARFEQAKVYEALGACTVFDGAQPQQSVQAALRARYGIAYASSAVAETGSVVQPCSADCGRAVTLAPLVHVAVVDEKDVVPTMADALAAYADADLPSQVCFISGPSATSDIELVRVEGVHGPMYVHYVIVAAT